jgi:pyruvate formate lyase activating enzyme
MQLSWLNKFSLLEYPSEISCVIFTPWCNFRCWFCHNPEFVLPEKLKETLNNLISEEEFFEFLESRQWLLSGVSICWWEPTLQKDLKIFCQKIKALGFKVKLDTNWRNPKIIKELIQEWLVDYIAMDIKTAFWKWNSVIWVKIDETIYLETTNLLLSSNIDYEFRTTLIKWVHNLQDIESIAKSISGAKNYYLQNFRSLKTLNPNFIWEPFNTKELEIFQKMCKKYVGNVEIRN